MKIKTTSLILMFLALLCCITPALTAQSFFSEFNDYLYMAFNGGLFLLAADNGVDADPPQIVPAFGVSAAYSVFRNLRIEFTEDIYFTNYEYRWEPHPGYPMACTPENRQAFVLGFVTGLHATGFFPITQSGISLRAYTGITADLRVVVQAFDLSVFDEEESKLQVDAINNYFWTKGRMLFFPMGAGMDFPINDKTLLGFDLRVWAPLYRLWNDENIPAIDGWRFGLGLRISPKKELHQLRPTRAPKPPRKPVQPEEESEENELTDE